MKSPLHLVAISILVLAGCGGQKSVASRSQAAYVEAKAKGVDVSSGSGGVHGGHVADADAPGTTSDSMAGMDHSKMDMSKPDSMSGMDHSKMDMSKPGSMPGMDHSKMDMSKPGSMPGMDHSKMGGMDMSGRDVIPQQGLWSAVPVTTSPTMSGSSSPPAPTSNSSMRQLSPSSTLELDAQDQTSPVSAAEAVKSSAMEHSMEGMDVEADLTSSSAMQHEMGSPSQPAHQQGQPTSVSPAAKKKSNAGSAKAISPAAAAVLYTCPMHPEVISKKAGNCPKCGMTLVKKVKR